MDMSAIVIAVTFILSVVIGAIGYLLHGKNEHQDKKITAIEEEIKEIQATCSKQHHDDAQELRGLELKLAQFYYQKSDITFLFTEFKGYLNERFDRIEQAIGLDKRHHRDNENDNS